MDHHHWQPYLLSYHHNWRRRQDYISARGQRLDLLYEPSPPFRREPSSFIFVLAGFESPYFRVLRLSPFFMSPCFFCLCLSAYQRARSPRVAPQRNATRAHLHAPVEATAVARAPVNPFRTPVPFWGQTTYSLSTLSPPMGARC